MACYPLNVNTRGSKLSYAIRGMQHHLLAINMLYGCTIASLLIVLQACQLLEPKHSPDTPHSVLVDVLYATDREIEYTDDNLLAAKYSSERSKLTFGMSRVSINTHKNTETRVSDETHWVKDDTYDIGDPAASIETLTPLDIKETVDVINQKVENSSDRTALVYVHGYAKDFDEVIRYFASYMYEIDYLGVPFVYSWPSKGSSLAYIADMTNSEWSASNFYYFLSKLAEINSIEKIHLVAHSMGNGALLSALSRIKHEQAQFPEWQIGEIILIAPDVDKGIFERDYVPVLESTGSRVTLYVSSNDFPLKISKIVHRHPRLGDSRSDPIIFNNIQTIKVSTENALAKNHDYYREEGGVLSDVHYLLNHDLDANDRPYLVAEDTVDGRFWHLFVD